MKIHAKNTFIIFVLSQEVISFNVIVRYNIESLQN
mgnify:CR=1 FL=1